jgi:hypothetical protein
MVAILGSIGTCISIPWASIRPAPIKQLKVTIFAAFEHTFSFHGHPFALHHFNSSR